MREAYLDVVDPVTFEAVADIGAGGADHTFTAIGSAWLGFDAADRQRAAHRAGRSGQGRSARERRAVNGRRVLLGVCGGIAAYKAAALASRLVQRGVELDVILTAEAQHFIGAATFAALARRRVWTSMWERTEEIPHIALVRDADVFAIVPATANAIAKLAQGIADDLLTNAALAARIPLVVAPAMNTAMLEHPATRREPALRSKRAA